MAFIICHWSQHCFFYISCVQARVFVRNFLMKCFLFYRAHGLVLCTQVHCTVVLFSTSPINLNRSRDLPCALGFGTGRHAGNIVATIIRHHDLIGVAIGNMSHSSALVLLSTAVFERTFYDEWLLRFENSRFSLSLWGLARKKTYQRNVKSQNRAEILISKRSCFLQCLDRDFSFAHWRMLKVRRLKIVLRHLSLFQDAVSMC